MVSEEIRKLGGKVFLAHLFTYPLRNYEEYLDSLVNENIMDVKQSDNNLSITNNDFLKYEDGKYYSDISDSAVYANYTLTTVATQS